MSKPHDLTISAAAFAAYAAFTSKDDAESAASLARTMLRETGTMASVTVARTVPELNAEGFVGPDIDLLEALAAKDMRVTAIKWLRGVSGSTLKEAKDWLDANFPAPAKVEEPESRTDGPSPALQRILQRAVAAGGLYDPVPPPEGFMPDSLSPTGCGCAVCNTGRAFAALANI